MLQIGYRVNNMRVEWIIPFIENYIRYFQTMEVKVSENFIKNIELRSFIEFCKNMGIKKLSFQLPDWVFASKKRCNETCNFLSNVESNSKEVFIAYFPQDGIPYKERLNQISKLVKDKSLILALENVPVYGNLFKYMEDMKNCAIENGFKICLDVGMLFYSSINNSTLEEVISFFENDLWWNENTVLIHFHDYSKHGYYFSLGDGYFEQNFGYLKAILKYFSEKCPIIFKTSIQDINTQGVIETKKFLDLWKSTKV